MKTVYIKKSTIKLFFIILAIFVFDITLVHINSDSFSPSPKEQKIIEKYNIKSTRPKFDDGLDKGNLVCDYIFVNDKVKVNDFRVIDTNISDHLPLILDFSI